MKVLITFVIAVLVFHTTGCATNQADHERAMLHLQIGTSYLQAGKNPQAMSELLKAEELDPKDPQIMNNLGLAYYVRGNLKQAEEKFRNAIAADRKFTDAKNNLGRVLIDADRLNEATKVL